MTQIPAEDAGATAPPTQEEIDRLARYCNVTDSGAREYLAECWENGVALVANYIGSTVVPRPLLRRACLVVASELYHQASAPGGVMQQFLDVGAQPVRMARNPMVGAYPLLDPFMPGGFA